MPLRVAPTVGTALAAPILAPIGTIPAYRITRAVDLKVLDQQPDTALTGFIPALTITPENTRPILRKFMR